MVWLQAALVATAFSGTAISGRGETVLLDFYADWCGPCRAMDPTINALVEQGFPVRKVNIDRNPQLAGKYGVGPIPCYVMLVEGREVDRVVGGTSFSRLKRICRLASDRRPGRQSSPLLAQLTAGQAGPPAATAAVKSAPPLETAAHQPGQRPPVQGPPEGPPSAPGWTPRRSTGATLDGALIAASVRLRVEDADGYSCGSGTIIDARQGEALILTCGHIFRDSQRKGQIEVDLFGPNGVQRVTGNLISYDCQKRDVGLVSIHTPGPVATARVAPPGLQIGPGEPVVSVGCNNGDRPTARHSRVTSLNKFMGPPNLQVAGLPVEGRSGGGLFSGDGLVIGVCNAADPSDREGLYAALGSIHAELDQAGLSYIYKAEGQGPATEGRPGNDRGTVPGFAQRKWDGPLPKGSYSSAAPKPAGAVAPGRLAAADPPPLPKRMPGPVQRAAAAELPARPATARAGDAAPLSTGEQAALDEIRRRLREGAEVICVVRSRRDPAAKSEVIILDKVSSNFLRQLAAESRSKDPLLTTSLEIPRKRQPAGNWAGSTGGWRSSALEPRARR